MTIKKNQYLTKLIKALILLFLLFPIIIFAQSNPMDVTTQTGSLVWNRLPSDAELDVASGELLRQLGGDVSVGGTVVDERRVEVSKIVKLHNKDLAGKGNQDPFPQRASFLLFTELTAQR